MFKPHVRIKYPWRLVIGDHCWIGQNVWIDNIADVTIGNHVCVSQYAYFCTGNHNHRSPAFDLVAKPIVVQTGAGWGRGSRCWEESLSMPTRLPPLEPSC